MVADDPSTRFSSSIIFCRWPPSWNVRSASRSSSRARASSSLSASVLSSFSVPETPHSAGRRWDWALWPPTAERGFAVFDHDGDGRIGEADIVHAAVVKNGERPSSQQVRRYIARADANGDGSLDEAEYLALLEMERREKRDREAT